jgi:hypothetical protein
MDLAGMVRFSAALAPLDRRPDWVGTPMVQRMRAERSPEEWQAIAPPVMTQPEEMDEGLAGRVLPCVGPKPWPLAEPPGRAR